ncbi:hypothetical protein H634G_09987 [Metarhizium anisopliae BRIP 53293]|uniref:Uncharacterized protein n=1 Tax=Metarhizium anisopliae BRIP 53293 TaxID=1291518 RepID=A0A0D9NLB9_METAN|nr:hypothetical protein H634G_09987 [Metarhizium anisopliae BRIP 53293]KJK85872.1 hypothetical protein H633G_10283 [Metarhizium anisopliae BRIP 53284]
MGQKAAVDCGRQWRWRENENKVAISTMSWLATSIWPCGSYSRTSHRLKAALSGQDAEKITNGSCCSADCAQFALCLPFYGCFLSKLQTTVRSFYGIDGNECSDWNEEEIKLREQHRRVKGHHHHEVSVMRDSGYHSVNPMTYLSPDHPRSAQSKLSPRGATKAGDEMVHHEKQPHDLCSDKVTAAYTVGYPQVHYLDQHWYLVPLGKGNDGAKKEDSKPLKSAIATIVGKHSLEDHELVVTGSVRSAHGLKSDVKTHYRGHSSSHQLHHDATTPTSTSSRASPHLLCCDPVAESKTAVRHDLQAHQPVQSSQVDHHHVLDKDVLVGTGGCAVNKHDIHAHEVVKSRGTEPPHQLKDDGTVGSSCKSWPHAMETDDVVATGHAGHVKHGLDSHKPAAVVGKRMASHELCKD